MADYAPDCDGCREMYAARTPPGKPPCETCREEVQEENTDALKTFFLIRYQLIMNSMGGAVDIQHEAIHKAMELYRIENRQQCFEKVLSLSRWWLERVNRRGDQ
jgi:hypothetical protein